MQFYRIGTEDEYHEPNEPTDQPYELKAVGLNSVAGVIIHVAEKTGWSENHITEKIPFKKLRWYLADAPALKKVKRKLTPILGSDLIKLIEQ